MSTNMMQQELKIDKAIDDRMNAILRQMQNMMDDAQPWSDKMEVNQIQNLLAVAQETDSVEVVKNFIRYQIGRDGGRASWGRSMKGPAFGDRLIDELDKLEKIAKSIVPADSDSLLAERAWMKLCRLYIGHLRRYFYYKKRSKGRGR